MTGTDPLGIPRLTIDVSAIVANWRDLCRRHASGAVGAVLKADGYGLGALPIASRLLTEGCRHFFVAMPDEAIRLRNTVPGAMLAVLNGLATGSERELAELDILPALSNLHEAEQWAGMARRLNRALPAMLHIDTGMARTGLSGVEIELLRDDPGLLSGIDIRYVLTHLVSAERPDDPVNEAQLAHFRALDWLLPGVPRSFANSSGIFLGPRFGSALARPGAALYGVNPTPAREHPLRAVVSLTAPVVALRDIPAGATVGYDGTWTAARPSRIATVGVGYADGWPRSLSGRGRAAFDGREVPLVGRVSMDLTTYDVTDAPNIELGSPAELIGPSRTLGAVAAEAGTNEYEILTSLGSRYHRTWL